MPETPPAPVDTAYGVDDFVREFAISARAGDALRSFDDYFLTTQAQMNLIARSTIADRWQRHYRDSAQLMRLIPANATSLVDMGSGAGFPGLILAALLAFPASPSGEQAHGSGKKVTLIESIGKKARFLTEAGKVMGLTDLEVIAGRVESLPRLAPSVITARAMASLTDLCAYGAHLAGPETLCIFPKGQDVEEELTQATKSWNMSVEQFPSLTNPQSRILVISELRARQTPAKVPQKGARRRRK